MTFWKRVVAIAPVATLVLITLSPQDAFAQGRRGFRRGFGGRAFFVAPYFGFGYGFGPYWGPWGPYGYAPAGGIDMGAALIAGYGAVDLNVKPGEAEVWVDGKYVAEAKDLDGYPSYLWLSEGPHRVVVYKGGYASFDEQIDVRRGLRSDLKVRLDKGDAQPPGQRPGNPKED
jgi:PEGA domain-containing protein